MEGHDWNYLYWASDKIDKSDLDELEKCSNNEGRPVIIHLDEIDGLSRAIQRRLLIKLDVRQTVYCIGTAASVRAKPVRVPGARRPGLWRPAARSWRLAAADDRPHGGT